MVEFEYIRSRGAHGHHAVGVFDAFVGSEREIWIGGDGSGAIRESRGPVAFFTEAGRAQWQAAGSPPLERGPVVELYAPGCLSRGQSRGARLARDPDGLTAALARALKTLRDVQALVDQAVVEPEFCQTVYDIACQLPGVDEIDELSDQLGRVGRGLAGTEDGERIELIFADDRSELLGYQWFLSESQPFAPAGSLHSWSSFLERAIVDRLPPAIRADRAPTPARARPSDPRRAR